MSASVTPGKDMRLLLNAYIKYILKSQASSLKISQCQPQVSVHSAGKEYQAFMVNKNMLDRGFQRLSATRQHKESVMKVYR